jgi:Cof subfamily protein (haloacid dehalogenase superfamily)
MKISALVSDVDGTLVTSAKQLTDRSRRAVAALQARGIRFAVISGRPPRGIRMLVEPLAITTPIAGFNGGALTAPDLTPIAEHLLAVETARRTHDWLRARGIDVWVYKGLDWLTTDIANPHVAPEIRAVGFQPTVVASLEPMLDAACKIVGVSADHALLARCEGELQAALGEQASASRSHAYYLDVTHPQANKGVGVTRLAELMGVPLAETMVIGDSHNDLGMFRQAGLAIAMGNADPEVKRHARFVTATNDEDGFAAAVHEYVLDR